MRFTWLSSRVSRSAFACHFLLESLDTYGAINLMFVSAIYVEYLCVPVMGSLPVNSSDLLQLRLLVPQL